MNSNIRRLPGKPSELIQLAEYREYLAREQAAYCLRATMKAKGVSRAELARRLEVSKPTVTQLLSGDRSVTVDRIAHVLHVLGCRLVFHVRDYDAPRLPGVNLHDPFGWQYLDPAAKVSE